MNPLKLINLKKGHRPKINITKKLEPFYSRIINTYVDLNEYKTKVTSDFKSIMGKVTREKSLKKRVLDIKKLNKKIKILNK